MNQHILVLSTSPGKTVKSRSVLGAKLTTWRCVSAVCRFVHDEQHLKWCFRSPIRFHVPLEMSKFHKHHLMYAAGHRTFSANACCFLAKLLALQFALKIISRNVQILCTMY